MFVSRYLFWSLRGKDGGIFRLDLNGVSDAVPVLIFNKYTVDTFAVDYERRKIVFPVEEINTVLSMDLHGNVYDDIRKNTVTPSYTPAKSFAIANDLFYWTSGEAFLKEEYYPDSNEYYIASLKNSALENYQFVCALTNQDSNRV